MKAQVNRFPKAFSKISGVVEMNLSKLVRKDPYMRTTIRNMIACQMNRMVADSIDFDDEEYLIRFLIDKGEPVCCEIGYAEDEWQLNKADYEKRV